MNAILTVNSPLRFTNSLVPSSGSISQKRCHPARSLNSILADSSDKTGMSGVSAASRAAITSCAARSASVSGEPSSLLLTSNWRSYTSRIWRPASIAMTMVSSSQRAGSVRVLILRSSLLARRTPYARRCMPCYKCEAVYDVFYSAQYRLANPGDSDLMAMLGYTRCRAGNPAGVPASLQASRNPWPGTSNCLLEFIA